MRKCSSLLVVQWRIRDVHGFIIDLCVHSTRKSHSKATDSPSAWMKGVMVRRKTKTKKKSDVMGPLRLISEMVLPRTTCLEG